MTKIDLRTGDCLALLREMPDESVTAIVTDPPYALSFMGKGWDKVLPDADIWRECLRVLKPGGIALVFGGTRTFHRLACNIEDAGFQVRDCLSWMYGSGFPKSLAIDKAIDKADGLQRPETGKATSSDRSRPWAGYGTALKPAWEPIILAMKPTDGTFAANALAHGVAGVNVDGCRLEDAEGGVEPEKVPNYRNRVYGRGRGGCAWRNVKGRWPANVVLDEDAAAMLDEQTNGKIHGAGAARKGSRNPRESEYDASSYKIPRNTGDIHRFGDSGGASRFLYCAKASKKDRGAGNTHPTVKPTALMRWLVRMVTMPEGTVVLDPFMGSGSTGVACVAEGVDFIGMEREPEYVEIAERRINE